MSYHRYYIPYIFPIYLYYIGNIVSMVVLSERTESLDVTSVARDFVSVNSRRLNYENISTLFVFTDFMFIIS